jgi:hypothetical protein
MKSFRHLLGLLVVASAPVAFGQTLYYYQGFSGSDPTGTLGGSGTFTVGSNANTSGPGLSYGTLQVSGGSLTNTGGGTAGTIALTSNPTGSVWLSTLFSTSGDVSGDIQNYLILPNNFRFGPAHWFGTGYTKGVGVLPNADPQQLQSGLTANTTYFLVANFTASGYEIWLNPTIGGSSPVGGTSVSGSATRSLQNFTVLMQDKNGMQFDELRIGDSFLAVTPQAVIPEPASFAVLAGLAGLGLAMSARRRRI